MKKTQLFTVGLGTGILAGYFINKLASVSTLSSERVLSAVKTALKNDLEIDGAWIYLHPEEWKNGKLHQLVYHGGVTENQDGEAIHYDFIADATTGTVIKLNEQ